MGELGKSSVTTMEASCGALVRELEQIWREIGEKEEDKDIMLMELEMECMKVYRRKLDESSKERTHLHQSLAASEAELASLMASLGESTVPIKLEKNQVSLRDRIANVKPLLEKLRNKKDDRLEQFIAIKSQIAKIVTEISGNDMQNGDLLQNFEKDQHDLSLTKLEEFQSKLTELQNEKNERLNKVLHYVEEINCLCTVLGFKFSNMENSKDLSDRNLERLSVSVQNLRQEKHTRVQKLRGIVEELFRLWTLMETSTKERGQFAKVASVFGSHEEEIVSPCLLSFQSINQAEEEVKRLKMIKSSRMKEIILKRWSELEEICKNAHIEPDMSISPDKSISLIDSGIVDPSEILEKIESQIEKAKEEINSRREITDKIAKWVVASDEENWLEEYNQDQSRYSAGRGAHLNLKRAEKARILVAKIPAMVDNLLNKTLSWENERNKPFLYDGVRLVTVLDEYKLARLQKEEEKRRYRDQKKLQNLLSTERELLYSPKHSPRRSPTTNFRKTIGYTNNLNGSGFMTPPLSGRATPELFTPRSCNGRSRMYFSGRNGSTRNRSTTQLNFSNGFNNADSGSSFASVSGSELGSPRFY
ncbi:hypothetical protein LUZ60_006101 [Juncus effusus]|nr:hypothetical protein LUZ60_006101 [Juncus effusus]